MWICPKCGQEVDTAHKFCGACGATADSREGPALMRMDVPLTAPAPRPRPLTAKQRALSGLKYGALYGAFTGGLYGLCHWVIMAVFAVEPLEQKLPWLLVSLLVGALLAIVIFAPVGVLLRLVFPPKPPKTSPPANPPSFNPS
jgi:hypothetical protein